MGVDSQTDSTVRASHWLLTVNNPTDEDRTLAKTSPRWLKSARGQEEIGAEGTQHFHIYINTDQVRWSAIKQWMPRAHIDVLKTRFHIDNAIKYVHKEDETTVAGTRWEENYRADTESLTFANVMEQMAGYAWEEADIIRKITAQVTTTESNPIVDPAVYKNRNEALTAEYWDIVNKLLAENPNLVGLLTQPQYLRAWINTRITWIKIVHDKYNAPPPHASLPPPRPPPPSA